MNLKLPFWTLIALIVLVVLNCTLPKEKTCDQFKIGDFEYRSNGLLYLIGRGDTVQTEVNKANGDITKNSIKWISNCSYQLRILESNSIYLDSINKLRMASTLTVEILRWTDDYYIYKSQSDLVDHVVIDTLWIADR